LRHVPWDGPRGVHQGKGSGSAAANRSTSIVAAAEAPRPDIDHLSDIDHLGAGSCTAPERAAVHSLHT